MHLYCLYGFGHDAPGHDCRLASGSLGYQLFFIWIMGCTLVTFGVTALLKIDPEFGKK